MVDRPPRIRTRRNTPPPLPPLVVEALPPSADPLEGMPIFRAEVRRVFDDLIEQTAPENGVSITVQLARRAENYTLNEIYRWAAALDAVPLLTLVHPDTRQQFTKNGAYELGVEPLIYSAAYTVQAPSPSPPPVASDQALQSALVIARRQLVTLGGEAKDDYDDMIQQAVLARVDAALKGAAK